MTDHSPARVPSGVPTGGQFAASAKTESDVALDVGPTSHEPASPAEQRVALAMALDGDFPGQFTIRDDGLTYRDVDGHEYQILQHDSGAHSVLADGLGASAYSHPMFGRDEMPAEHRRKQVGASLRAVIADATDMRRFNGAVTEYAADCDMAGYADFDERDSTLVVGLGEQAVLTGYTRRHPATGGPGVDIVIKGGADSRERQFMVDLDQSTASGDRPERYVIRTEEGDRLADWEASAVLSEFNRRAGAPVQRSLRVFVDEPWKREQRG